MPKQFTYRGYTFEDLKTISMDEFIPLLSSRRRRSLQRGLTRDQRILLESIRKTKEISKEGKKGIVRTHARDMVILPEFVSVVILVHNGKEFVSVEITPEMIGHRLGEFAITNKPVRHGMPGIGASRSSMYVPLK